MPLAYLFWGLYIACFFLGVWGYYEVGQPWYRRASGYVMLWALVGMLGWHAFGAAVK